MYVWYVCVYMSVWFDAVVFCNLLDLYLCVFVRYSFFLCHDSPRVYRVKQYVYFLLLLLKKKCLSLKLAENEYNSTTPYQEKAIPSEFSKTWLTSLCKIPQILLEKLGCMLCVHLALLCLVDSFCRAAVWFWSHYIFQITLHLAQRVTTGLFYQSLHHHLDTARPSTCDSHDISAISQGQVGVCIWLMQWIII